MTAVMGFTITPPLPFMSRDTLPKIDMYRDMKQSVNTDGFPLADSTTEADDAWDPRPLTEKEKDKKTQYTRWDNVVAAWKTTDSVAAAKRSEKVVKVWAARLRFAEGALTGRKPAALIARFDAMVPAAPAIAVGSD